MVSNKLRWPVFATQHRSLRTVVSTLLSLMLVVASSASTTTSKPKVGGFPLHGTTPDPFVEASPLVVGVACSDGVLLLAVHTVFSETSNNDESFLLLRESDDDDSNEDDRPMENENTAATTAATSLDLPRSYRGPFRIYSLDDSGSAAMVCTGWRNDGKVLADHLLSQSRKEQLIFGLPHSFSNAGGFLADAATLFLARSCISESTRTLSCAGLLGGLSRLGSSGLWLVDATGAYAVRAHALGRGSKGANNYLKTKNWKAMDCSSAKTEVLRWLVSSQEEGSDDNDGFMRTAFPKGSRVEIAETTTTPQHKTMKRLFAAT